MMKKAGSLRSKIRQAFSAFAFEHSGEMLSITRKDQLLSGGNRNYSVSQEQKHMADQSPSSRRILMSVDKVINPELLRYTMDAARRLDASVDILSSQSYEEIFTIMEKEINVSPVSWRLIKLDKELLSGLADYVTNHPEILFMVTGQPRSLIECSAKSRYAA